MTKNKISSGAIGILAVGVALYGLVMYGMLDGRESSFVQQKAEMLQSGSWYVWLVVHALSGSIALLVGWLQFSAKLRANRPQLHRSVGILYAAAIGVAGFSGVFLSLFASGGLPGQLGFGFLSLAWLVTTGAGIYAIAAPGRDAKAHGRWMLRSYALTLAAVTLRVYLPLSMLLFGLESYETYYGAIAWLCWVPNLLAAEWLIRRRSAVSGPALRS